MMLALQQRWPSWEQIPEAVRKSIIEADYDECRKKSERWWRTYQAQQERTDVLTEAECT